MDAILRAKMRGMRWFDMGELPMPGDGTNKERAIGFFKKAFTSRVDVHAQWLLPGALESGNGNPMSPNLDRSCHESHQL
jgi:hypothetical protein